MALATQEKSDIVGKFARGENDTGSLKFRLRFLLSASTALLAT